MGWWHRLWWKQRPWRDLIYSPDSSGTGVSWRSGGKEGERVYVQHEFQLVFSSVTGLNSGVRSQSSPTTETIWIFEQSNARMNQCRIIQMWIVLIGQNPSRCWAAAAPKDPPRAPSLQLLQTNLRVCRHLEMVGQIEVMFSARWATACRGILESEAVFFVRVIFAGSLTSLRCPLPCSPHSAPHSPAPWPVESSSYTAGESSRFTFPSATWLGEVGSLVECFEWQASSSWLGLMKGTMIDWWRGESA